MNKLRLVLTFLLAIGGSAAAAPEQLTSPAIKGAPDFSAISNASTVRTQLGAATATDSGGIVLASDEVRTDGDTPTNTGLTKALTAGTWLIQVESTFAAESTSPGVKIAMSYTGATMVRETASIAKNSDVSTVYYGYTGTSNLPLSHDVDTSAGASLAVVVTVATTGSVTFQVIAPPPPADLMPPPGS